jgi:hypothetical protein
MSHDDARFMAQGCYVRHKYRRRRAGRRTDTCVRCGVKRRYTGADWEYFGGVGAAWSPFTWTTANPPCVLRSRK